MVGQNLTPRRLGRATPVGVGGVEEVDTGIERGVGTGTGLLSLHTAGVGQPRTCNALREPFGCKPSGDLGTVHCRGARARSLRVMSAAKPSASSSTCLRKK